MNTKLKLHNPQMYNQLFNEWIMTGHSHVKYLTPIQQRMYINSPEIKKQFIASLTQEEFNLIFTHE